MAAVNFFFLSDKIQNDFRVFEKEPLQKIIICLVILPPDGVYKNPYRDGKKGERGGGRDCIARKPHFLLRGHWHWGWREFWERIGEWWHWGNGGFFTTQTFATDLDLFNTFHLPVLQKYGDRLKQVIDLGENLDAAKKAIDLGFEICGDKSLDHLLDHLLESS